MKQNSATLTAKDVRSKDQKMPFDTGKGHEKQIDDVQRIMKPVPERTEDFSRWIDMRSEHVRLRERHSESNEEKRNEEKKKENIKAQRFPQVSPVTVEKKRAEKSEQGNDL